MIVQRYSNNLLQVSQKYKKCEKERIRLCKVFSNVIKLAEVSALAWETSDIINIFIALSLCYRCLVGCLL